MASTEIVRLREQLRVSNAKATLSDEGQESGAIGSSSS